MAHTCPCPVSCPCPIFMFTLGGGTVNHQRERSERNYDMRKRAEELHLDHLELNFQCCICQYHGGRRDPEPEGVESVHLLDEFELREIQRRKIWAAKRRDKGLNRIHNSDVDLFAQLFGRPARGYLCDVCIGVVRAQVEMIQRRGLGEAFDFESDAALPHHGTPSALEHTGFRNDDINSHEAACSGSPIPHGTTAAGIVRVPRSSRMDRNEDGGSESTSFASASVVSGVTPLTGPIVSTPTPASAIQPHKTGLQALEPWCQEGLKQDLRCQSCGHGQCYFYDRKKLSFCCNNCFLRRVGKRALIDLAKPMPRPWVVFFECIVSHRRPHQTTASQLTRSRQLNTLFAETQVNLFDQQQAGNQSFTPPRPTASPQPPTGVIGPDVSPSVSPVPAATQFRFSEADFGAQISDAEAKSRVLKKVAVDEEVPQPEKQGAASATGTRRQHAKDQLRSTTTSLFEGRNVHRDGDLFSEAWCPVEMDAKETAQQVDFETLKKATGCTGSDQPEVAQECVNTGGEENATQVDGGARVDDEATQKSES